MGSNLPIQTRLFQLFFRYQSILVAGFEVALFQPINIETYTNTNATLSLSKAETANEKLDEYNHRTN